MVVQRKGKITRRNETAQTNYSIISPITITAPEVPLKQNFW